MTSFWFKKNNNNAAKNPSVIAAEKHTVSSEIQVRNNASDY